MDHSTAFRNKFWFVFFGLFVFWYFLLYEFDWSSLPGLTSISINVDRSIESLSLTSNVMKERDIIIKTVNFDDNESGRLNTVVVPTSSIVQQEEEKKNDTSCKDRYIYVHDLPTRYNEDLLKQCKKFNKWNDLCPYLTNMGLGHELGNPQRIFLNRGWFNTQQFNLEVIFHNRMKQYDCLTNDSSEATAIYVPYYAGLDVARYLWSPFNGSIKDADSLDLMKWLRSKPEWGGRMWGKDHFLVAGRITWDFRRGNDTGDDSGWGNNLMRLPESINMTMLTIESSPWHKNDFAIPYPTYFHPSTYDDVLLWQNKIRKQRRRTLFCFAGAPRPNMVDSIRDEIMSQCQESSSGGRRTCKLLECKNDKNKCNKPLYLMKLFQSSVFCLQPSGDSFTRRSTFDSILAGCIPVFFTPASAYVQYLWHLPEKNFSSYSVMISEEDVKNKNVSIEGVLSRIPAKKVSAMREEVIKLIPKVIYADPRSKVHKFKDAFDLTVEGVIKRVEKLKKEMEKGEKFDDFDEESSWKYYTFGTVDEHEWDSFFLRTQRDRY